MPHLNEIERTHMNTKKRAGPILSLAGLMGWHYMARIAIYDLETWHFGKPTGALLHEWERNDTGQWKEVTNRRKP